MRIVPDSLHAYSPRFTGGNARTITGVKPPPPVLKYRTIFKRWNETPGIRCASVATPGKPGAICPPHQYPKESPLLGTSPPCGYNGRK